MMLDEKLDDFLKKSKSLKNTVVSYIANNKGKNAAQFINAIYELKSLLKDIEYDVNNLTGGKHWSR